MPSNGTKGVHQHWQDENTHRKSEVDDESTHRRRLASRQHPSTSSLSNSMHDLPTSASEAARLDRELSKFFDFTRVGGAEPESDFEERVCWLT